MKIRALISVACAALASGAPLVWHAGPLRQPSVPFAMDIHLPVLGAAADAARAANAVLNAGLNSTAIDFANGVHTPHITLYLTQWSCDGLPAGAGSIGSGAPLSCLEKIETAIAEVSREWAAAGACQISLGSVYAAGGFAMMNVSNSDCLQVYSDVLVTATHRFAQPGQPAPAWVLELPEPERSEKLRDIALYGSPNVFSQFSPHISVAWSPNASAVAAAVAGLPPSPALTFSGQIVRLGRVGPHGTVVAGRDLGWYNVSLPGDAVCRQVHVSAAACDKDTLSGGGCAWCVTLTARGFSSFCTTQVRARQLPLFPLSYCHKRRRTPSEQMQPVPT